MYLFNKFIELYIGDSGWLTELKAEKNAKKPIPNNKKPPLPSPPKIITKHKKPLKA